MTNDRTHRYYADPVAIELMKRDGIGWGHDPKSGSVIGVGGPRRSHLITRIANVLKG